MSSGVPQGPLPGPDGQVYGELQATRAVIAGRRTYEHAGHWQGDHHDGVPIFVLTSQVPADPPPGSVRYVTEVSACAEQARAAAGDGDVMVHGAGAAQALLGAGQLDELELHVVPVLLGQGRRLFDHLAAEPIELELLRTLTPPDVDDRAQRVTHLRYCGQTVCRRDRSRQCRMGVRLSCCRADPLGLLSEV